MRAKDFKAIRKCIDIEIGEKNEIVVRFNPTEELRKELSWEHIDNLTFYDVNMTLEFMDCVDVRLKNEEIIIEHHIKQFWYAVDASGNEELVREKEHFQLESFPIWKVLK